MNDVEVKPYGWLPDRVTRAWRVMTELRLHFDWAPARAASPEELAAARIRFGDRISASHLAFLSRHDGANFGYSFGERGEERGSSWRIFSIAEIVAEDALLRGLNGETPKLRKRESTRWGRLLPIADIRDSNYLFTDGETLTNGEAAVIYGDHELGPERWRQTGYLAYSFESFLLGTFDAIAYRQMAPDLWHDVGRRLRPNEASQTI